MVSTLFLLALGMAHGAPDESDTPEVPPPVDQAVEGPPAVTQERQRRGWQMTFGGEVGRRSFTLSRADIVGSSLIIGTAAVLTVVERTNTPAPVSQITFVPNSQTRILQYGETYRDWAFGQVRFAPDQRWRRFTDVALYAVPLATMLVPTGPDLHAGGVRRAIARRVVILEAMSAGWVLTGTLKYVAGRPRPWTYYEPTDAWVGDGMVFQPDDFGACEPEVGCTYQDVDTFHAFPSGHTTVVTAAGVAWVTTALLARRGRIGARYLALAAPMTLGALVGVGRVRGGKHHPSDVVAGWAVGVASGILVPLVHAHVPDNVDIGVGPGSVAVTVTL